MILTINSVSQIPPVLWFIMATSFILVVLGLRWDYRLRKAHYKKLKENGAIDFISRAYDLFKAFGPDDRTARVITGTISGKEVKGTLSGNELLIVKIDDDTRHYIEKALALVIATLALMRDGQLEVEFATE